MRGENAAVLSHMVIAAGTSPRARGKLGRAFPVFTGGRNIPACAGKTIPSITTPGVTPEHPRVRGENRHV